MATTSCVAPATITSGLRPHSCLMPHDSHYHLKPKTYNL
jgi:hypothetical protein